MAAPASKNLKDLNGRWVLNKLVSDSTEPALALQGIGWLTRKGISAAGLTLEVKQYTAKDTEGKQPDDTWEAVGPDSEESVIIYFDQYVSGGFKGTAEKRHVNGLLHGHTDWLFGTVNTQNVFRELSEILAFDDAYLAGRDAKAGPWLDDGVPFLYTQARSVNGWVARQVWGFQTVDVEGEPERRFSRNVVVTKGTERVQMRLVYDYEEQ